jgi:hypothetical protein
MSKIKQDTIPVIIDEDNLMKIAIEQGVIENEFNWKLVRERDELTKYSKEVIWLEFNEDGTFKSKNDEPAVGRSLLMSPLNQFFTWQTTSITEIVDLNSDMIKFKTQNSIYTLTQI